MKTLTVEEQYQVWVDAQEDMDLAQDANRTFWDEQCAQPLGMDRDDLPF